MAYTTPRTWSTGELVTATMMNAHVRDNFEAVKDPPTAIYNVNEGADYTTTSTSFAAIDSTDLSLSITTTGGDILCVFFGMFTFSGTSTVLFDFTLDGTLQGTNDGYTGMRPGGSNVGQGFVCLPVLLRSVSAASHTVQIHWKLGGAGTATMYAGAGTSTADVHPQMWIREVS